MKFLICAAIIFYSAFFTLVSNAQDTAEVLVLGTFHFAYPDLDIIKTDEENKIDILSPERQAELADVIERLIKFNPTKIAIEQRSWSQPLIDSLYKKYLSGSLKLPADEMYQLGFRMAKMLNHNKIYCIDEWGNLSAYGKLEKDNFEINPDKKELFNKLKNFIDSVYALTAIEDKQKGEYKYMPLTEILLQINQPEKIKSDHEKYFTRTFLFEESENDYAGVDWLTASWFNRNLRIFRNIQRITDSSDERILAIYGSGHLALLKQYIEDSPDHTFVSAVEYLK